MYFSAEIIKEKSLDPYFKLKFTYKTDRVDIEAGFADVLRKEPMSVITFDSETKEKLLSEDTSKLELELLHIVVKYLFSRGITRTKKGKVIVHNG